MSADTLANNERILWSSRALPTHWQVSGLILPPSKQSLNTAHKQAAGISRGDHACMVGVADSAQLAWAHPAWDRCEWCRLGNLRQWLQQRTC